MLTDETIDSLVALVEAAEVMAQTMDMTVSKAMRFMLKASQMFQRIQQRTTFDMASILAKPGKPS